MMHRAFLALLFIVSVSSTSLLKKSIVRRQTDAQSCQAIQGFDCKCSYYRVTCTTDGDIQGTINVLPNEREKYESVELVIQGERDYNIYDSTFESIKQLYKPDPDNLEFRVKFEKFTALHLRSASVFNRAFPDNLRTNARKHMALEIYNPLVQPQDNPNLFQNLNVDSLELYVLYPFRGTFQQLFQGANIKYLRLSGGDITSDLSQPFSGNIGRLELVKQASSISVQNFPVYPAHELIIDAFYVSDFNSEHPPNYSNLGEIRVYTQERVPANAFRQFPNLHTLSITTDKEIDPQAFSGLNKLEKLTIKDTTPSLDLLANLPQLKEFETSFSKLDDRTQCQLIEKLSNGQLAVQAVPNGQECTCASAYLDAATGRYPCQAANCDQSTCAAIRSSYDASTNTFRAPPAIRRSDGSDALRQREARVYTAPFQVSRHDQEKLQQVQPQQQPQQHDQQNQQDHYQQPNYDPNAQQPNQYNDQQNDGVTPPGQPKKSRRTKPRTGVTTPSYDQQAGGADRDHSQQQPGAGDHDHSQQQPSDHHYHPQPPATDGTGDHRDQDHDQGRDRDHSQDHDHDQSHGGSMGPVPGQDQQQQDNADDNDNQDNNDNRPDADGNANQQGDRQGDNQGNVDGSQGRNDGQADDAQSTDAPAGVDGVTDGVVAPPKKGWGWLLWVIIAACILGLIIALVLFFCLKGNRNRGYNAANTNEAAAAAARA